MKYLTLILITFCNCFSYILAQDIYQLPAKTRIYDLPGDHFLTVNSVGSTTYLQERSANGNAIWEDSISASGELAKIDSVYIQQFGKLDQFCLIQTQKAEATYDSINLVYRTLDLSTHFIGEKYSVKLLNKGQLSTAATDDNLIYVSTSNYENKQQFIALFTISVAGELKTHASARTMALNYKSNPFGYSFESNGVDITVFFNEYGDLYTQRYSKDLNTYQPVDTSKIARIAGHFTELAHLNRVSNDSILTFHYSYKHFGDDTNAWILSWNDQHLHSYKNKTVDFPYKTDTNYYAVGLKYTCVTSDRIYILVEKDGKDKIQVLNYDFDFVCTIYPGPMGNRSYKKLIILNDEAYLSEESENELKLTRIDHCGILSGIEETAGSGKFNFSIYPNPGSSEFYINTTNNVTGKEVYIQNSLGQTLEKTSLENAHENRIQHQLPAGVYFVKIIGQEAVKRLVIQ